MEEYLLAVIRGERRWLWDLPVLAMLSFLERIYRVAIWIRTRIYQWGIVKEATMGIPVVSLGNLSVGGTGKTPLTINLAQRFLSYGIRPAVLIRGYRGQGAGARVVSNGKEVLLPLENTGDEAQLLARCLPGVPVVAGKDRVLGGRLAKDLGAELLLLDDGFQYLKLRRDLDIVLLDAERPWENGHLLPRGLLREGPKGLRRAGLVVLSGTDVIEESDYQMRLKEIKAWNETVPVIRAGVQTDAIQSLASWWNNPSELRDPQRFFDGQVMGMMTAIARPEKFRQTLRRLGAEPRFELLRSDHHPWNIQDLHELEMILQEERGAIVVTTEKDAVKLEFALASPIAEQIHVLRIRTVVPSGDSTVLESVLKEWNS